MSKIHSESGCRLPLPSRDELDERGKAVWDRQLDPASRSVVGLKGPPGIRLHSPVIAENAQAILHFFRNDSVLDEATREVAILTTARAHDSNYEWAAHEPLAVKFGVPRATINAIRDNGPVDELPERDALIIAFGRAMFRERQVPDDLFDRALTVFEKRGLVELVTLMVMYAGTASLLVAFDMQLPDGAERVFS